MVRDAPRIRKDLPSRGSRVVCGIDTCGPKGCTGPASGFLCPSIPFQLRIHKVCNLLFGYHIAGTVFSS
jgi:hypothetical protein